MIKTSTIGLVMLCLLPFAGRAQAFELQQENDSLYWLTAMGGNKADGWRLTYPVYQFQTGDVDGDGSEDAMVGVIKGTRFYPQKARRLFIFKQVDGHSSNGEACKKVRPMWMGTELGDTESDPLCASLKLSFKQQLENPYNALPYP